MSNDRISSLVRSEGGGGDNTGAGLRHPLARAPVHTQVYSTEPHLASVSSLLTSVRADYAWPVTWWACLKLTVQEHKTADKKQKTLVQA